MGVNEVENFRLSVSEDRHVLTGGANGWAGHVAGQVWSPEVPASTPASMGATFEAAKIESLILRGNATELQREIMAHKANPEQLRETMRLVHDDMVSRHLDVQLRQRGDSAQVFVGSQGHTILDFGDNFSVYGRPMIGYRDNSTGDLGTYREGSGAENISPDEALKRVLSEAAAHTGAGSAPSDSQPAGASPAESGSGSAVHSWLPDYAALDRILQRESGHSDWHVK